jgi:predicted Zn-dependent protease
MCTCLQNARCHPQSTVSRRRAPHLIACTVVAPTLSGCDRIAPFVVSEETVEQLGLETWARLRQQMPISRNAGAQQQVAEIARRLLVAAGEDPSRWEVQVFAEPQANAFVLPGRKIGVLEGLLRKVLSTWRRRGKAAAGAAVTPVHISP